MASSPRTSRNRPGHPGTAQDASTSMVRTVVAALLAAVGIAWLVVYQVAGQSSTGALGWMAGLGRWNYLIGFLLLFVGLVVAAHPGTPLGRGRGVVVGMLGCFLVGLAWIVVYYITGQDQTVPLIRDLGQYNLVVGIGFMAVGFVYATHWE
ncbi:MAG: cell division protein CrgA [Nocardioidaceae bacterium]